MSRRLVDRKGVEDIVSNMADDLLFYTACGRFNIRYVKVKTAIGVMKNLVYPFVCYNETNFVNAYRNCIVDFGDKISNLAQEDEVVVLLCPPVIKFGNGMICGFFELFWMEASKYVQAELDFCLRQMSKPTIH